MAKVRVPVHRTSPTQSVLIDRDATVGAQIGVNLLLPDGTLAKMSDFGSTPATDGTSLNTTDDLDEGQWNLWFTNLRAQDAVGGILADSTTISLAYVGGASITATLNDLADSGTGSALVKLTRDAKGRISGTEAATTTDLAEGSNLYFTNERAQDAIGAALVGTGDVPLTYDDAGNTISAALSSGVLASLALADSATQPGDLAAVATTGAYADLSGLPTLGTAAATASTDYATAAQGAKADSAVQSVVPGTGVSVDNTDPQNPVISATGGGGSGDVVGPASAVDGDLALFDGITGKLIKSGGALDKAAVGLGNADNTSDVNKPVSTAQAIAIALKLDITTLADYIGGLKMVWVSGTALTVSSGAAYIEGAGKVLRAPSAIAKTGLSLTASTWYHVYLYDNAGTPAVEVVTTAPASPYNGTARSKTGDTSRRYVGSVLTDVSGAVYRFMHDGDAMNYVVAREVPFRCLNGGNAGTRTNVDLSPVMPESARTAMLQVVNTGGNQLFLDVPESGLSGSVTIDTCTGGQRIFLDMPTASRTVIYFYGVVSGSAAYIDVRGYRYGR